MYLHGRYLGREKTSHVGTVGSKYILHGYMESWGGFYKEFYLMGRGPRVKGV